MSVDMIFSLGVESSDTTLLSAATYVGGGQTIVKLIPEALIEAESLAQATLGLNLSEAHPVGKSEPRAVGFPAWPIIHDPDNARHALNLVGDLEWARRYAKNQAKKVKDPFDALAGDLTNSAPHFVPTLFEELARIFSAVGNEKFAKQYFGRAREVERAHGVPVDPARHEAAFLEFAQSGVVGTKDMTQEATDAPHRFDSPEAAFEYVLHLNIARVRAGQPPYAYLARDLRKLGKAAGLSANEVDARLFDGIVGLSAVQKAPGGGFWKAMRAPLIAWLKSNPDRGEAFVSHQPKEFSMEDWLAFLDESGAWQNLVADDEAFLAWMQTILKRQSYELGRFSPRLLTAFELIGDALRGTRVVGGIRQLPLEYVDALVAGGAQWDLTSRWSRDGVDWNEWAKQATRSRDLRALAAHPEISELAVKSLSSGFVPESLDLLLAVPGAKELLSRHLDRIASRVVAAQGAFAELSYLIYQDLRYLTDPRLMELNPQAMKTMTAFDAQEALSWAIRAGVLAELTWPALEESVARLRAASPGKQIRFFDSHPDLIVVCGDCFEVISGDSVRITGDLPVDIQIKSAFSVGDEAVFFYQGLKGWKIHAYWNGDIGQEVDGNSSGYHRGSLGVSFPVLGGRLTGDGLLKSGATDHQYDPGILVCSLNSDQIFAFGYRGVSQWLAAEEKFSDPEVTSTDLARLGLDELGITHRIDLLEPTIFPAFASTKDSLAGTFNGKHVTVRSASKDTYRAVTPLGTFSAPVNFHYALNRPGGGIWLARDLTLIDAESGNHLSRYAGYLDWLPANAVHQLQPRSLKASKSMRSCRTSDAKKLLAKLQAEPGRIVSNAAAERRSNWRHNQIQVKESTTVNSEIGSPAWKAASKFLHSNDPVWVRAVVELAADAAALELQIARLRHKLVTPPPVVVKPVKRELSAEALFEDLIDWRSSLDIYRNVPEAFEVTWDRLQSAKTQERQPRIGETFVYRLIGHERALLGMLAAQASAKAAVQELSELFREFTKSGLFCSGWRSVYVLQKTVEWKNGEWIDGALVVGPKGWDGYEVLIFGVRPAIAGFPVVEGSDKRISAEDFLAGLSALESGAEISRDENAAELARKTTLAPDFCTYLMSGVAGRSRLRSGRVVDERIDEHRKALGFSITAFKTAQAQLAFEPWSLLQAMYAACVPLSNPATVATHPDIAAMAAAWSAEVGDQGYRITEAQHRTVLRAIEPLPRGDDQRILRPLDLQNDSYSADYRYIAPLLTLAANSRGDDPIRPFIAQQLETNREYIEQQKSDKNYRDYIQDIELGDSFNKLKGSHSVHATRVLTEGLVDELIEDLRLSYESPAGHPLDPLVSAPKVVADMATTLDLGEDSARYYLQVLALTTPTDLLIREWNDWTKKDLDAAAAPLIDRGLLITAKRSGAGRTRFLPGGWLEAASGEKGFEVWKAPHYLLWKDPKVHPVVRTCLPLVPIPQLYADVWARYQSGDVPGYEELRTQRYRRR